MKQDNKRNMVVTYQLRNGKTYYIGNDKKHYLITDTTSCEEIKRKAHLYNIKGVKCVISRLWKKLSWVDDIDERIIISQYLTTEYLEKNFECYGRFYIN